MWHIAASAYFKISDVHTLPALITGAINDYFIASAMGVAIIYFLYLTGTDFFWIKGASIGGAWWLFAFGIVLRTKIGRIDPTDPGTNLYHITEHLLLGILIAWLITKYAKEVLER